MSDDTVGDLVQLLTTNWSITTSAIIDAIYNRKEILAPNNWILLYETAHNTNIIDLGYNNKREEKAISIDIRTWTDRNTLYELRNEVLRILYANRKGWNDWDIIQIEDMPDLSDRSIKLWRIVINIRLIDYAKQI